jgi:hypothetical protein
VEYRKTKPRRKIIEYLRIVASKSPHFTAATIFVNSWSMY